MPTGIVCVIAESYRKTPRAHHPPPFDSGSDSDTMGTPAAHVAAAIGQFRHLIGSPWITLTRGSSSKRKRQQEARERAAQSIVMDDPLSDGDQPGQKRFRLANGSDGGRSPARRDPPAETGSEATSSSAEMLSALSSSDTEPEPVSAPEPASDTEPEPEPVSEQQPELEPVSEQPPEPEPVSEQKSKPEPVTEQRSQPEPATKPELKPAAANGRAPPPEAQGELRSVTGQARLLIRERFGQFEGLVDSAEFLRGPRPTTLTDLQGFWEMIYFQVEDVDRKFARLTELEAAGWQEAAPASPPAPAAAAAAPAKAARKPPAAGRRSALPLTELNANTAELRQSRRSRRLPSLLGDCGRPSPLATTGEDLMTFDSPAPRQRDRPGHGQLVEECCARRV
ncbi:translation initiation factor IF-2-like [Pollicipes pollicipes]|uniref:translation initiation factor IF-2-like n=1 Tax=Pollicipes pollicipes TaxID=41117 RepID=UPI00188512AC|nr:translation initiation factor IF-2-like [Pollicipes pollicipes]